MKKCFLHLGMLLLVAMFSVSCCVTYPIAATSNTIGTRTGKSKAVNAFGFWINGDASVRTAAKDAGITKISTVDQNQCNYLGIVRVYETIITGE